jgi:hypothetical protein
MDLTALLASFYEGANVVKEFAIAVCSLALGWYLVGNAAFRMTKWGDPRRTYGWGSVSARFIVGTFFINAHAYINMQVLTVTGQAMPLTNSMSVMPGGGDSVPKMIFQCVLAWMATMGVLAIIKGTRLIVKAGDGGQSQVEDPGWTAAVFIVAGAFGVNLWRFVGPLI